VFDTGACLIQVPLVDEIEDFSQDSEIPELDPPSALKSRRSAEKMDAHTTPSSRSASAVASAASVAIIASSSIAASVASAAAPASGYEGMGDLSSRDSSNKCRYCRKGLAPLPWAEDVLQQKAQQLYCSHECWEQFCVQVCVCVCVCVCVVCVCVVSVCVCV
jgi:hypothetical protein